jgi:hypothetical protein
MKKGLIFCLALFVAMLMAAPSTFTVKKLPAGSAPNIDGDMSEWVIDYFVDSLHSDDNCYYREASGGGLLPEWARDKYQMEAYMTWDDAWVYYAVKITGDDDPQGAPATCAYDQEALKVNPGGQAMAFYLCNSGDFKVNPSSPYTVGVTLKGGANPTGNTGLPTYEFAIDLALLDPFNMQMWQLSVGTEDNATYFMGLGAEYTGPKDDGDGNPWDNPLYYPTYTLSSEEGPSLAIESGLYPSHTAENISASPNPFRSAAYVSYKVKNAGSLKIYNVSGKVVKSFNTKAGSGKVMWDGTDKAGKRVSSGIYIARIISGKNRLNARLFLAQ